MKLPLPSPAHLGLGLLVVALASGCTQSQAPAPLAAEQQPAAADAASPAAAPDAAERAPAAADYARVVSVTPVKRRVDHPRQVCEDRVVTRQARPKDENKVTGTVVGALVGGVAGNQVGDGRGRDLATVAGVVGGAVAGRKIQENQQRKNTVTHVENVCRTVNDATEEVYAYDVGYEYAGTVLTARLDHDPGDRVKLPVRGMVQ